MHPCTERIIHSFLHVVCVCSSRMCTCIGTTGFVVFRERLVHVGRTGNESEVCRIYLVELRDDGLLNSLRVRHCRIV